MQGCRRTCCGGGGGGGGDRGDRGVHVIQRVVESCDRLL